MTTPVSTRSPIRISAAPLPSPHPTDRAYMASPHHPSFTVVTPSSTLSAPPKAPSSGVIDPFFGRVLTPLEQAYVREFSGFSVARLEKEPRLLQAESARIQKEVEELSLANYPTFLQTNTVLKQSEKNLKRIDANLTDLHQAVLPALTTSCQAFLDRSTTIMASVQSHRELVSQQNFLLELLEIPTLMDTCFKAATAPTTSEREKNKLINDALQLDQYVKELIQQQQRQQTSQTPSSSPSTPVIPPILLSIQTEMSSMKRNIVNHLLQQLRSNISAITEEEELPEGSPPGQKPVMITIPEVVVGIRIVGLLKRTLDMFAGGSESGGGRSTSVGLTNQNIFLKYQFLLSRNAFFESVLKGLQVPVLPATIGGALPSATSGPASAAGASLNLQVFKYLEEYLSVHRTNLFNITTLYSALFLDADDATSTSSNASADSTSDPLAQSSTAADDLGLLCRWLHRRMAILLHTLDVFLPHLQDGSSYLTLLHSAMSCASGLSRSKIGLDFRPLLTPMFEKHILRLFERSVEAAAANLENNMREYAWKVERTALSRMGFKMDQTKQHLPSTTPATQIESLLNGLLEYPPLALLGNGLVLAFNELTKCAPLSLAKPVGACLEKSLEACIQKIKNTQTPQSVLPPAANTSLAVNSEDQDGVSAMDPLLELAHGFELRFLLLADALLRHCYPESRDLLDLPRLHASLSILFEEERLEAANKKERQLAAAAAAATVKANAIAAAQAKTDAEVAAKAEAEMAAEAAAAIANLTTTDSSAADASAPPSVPDTASLTTATPPPLATTTSESNETPTTLDSSDSSAAAVPTSEHDD